MNVQGPTTPIALLDSHLASRAVLGLPGDPGCHQVTVQYPHQQSGHGKKRLAVWQAGGHWFPAPSGGFLGGRELVGTPSPKVRCQVCSKRYPGALPVLLIGGMEQGIGCRPVKFDLADGQGSKLALPKPGQYQCLVDQGTLPAERFQAGDSSRPELGGGFALVLAPANGHRVQQRAPSGDFQQGDKFRFGQCPAVSARVGLLVCLGYPGQDVRRKPPGRYAPVAERHHRHAVGVAASGGHALAGPIRKPSLQDSPVKVRQLAESAISRHAPQTTLGIAPMLSTCTFGCKVGNVGGKVAVQGGALMVDHGVLRGRCDPALDVLGPPDQFGQHIAGGGFIPAACRYLADNAASVAVLGGVGSGLLHDPHLPGVLAFLRHCHLGRLHPAPAVGPSGELVSLAAEHVRAGR